ncbi:hypothetical protein OURE66S_00876 [Oligella ureolytica]
MGVLPLQIVQGDDECLKESQNSLNYFSTELNIAPPSEGHLNLEASVSSLSESFTMRKLIRIHRVGNAAHEMYSLPLVVQKYRI